MIDRLKEIRPQARVGLRLLLLAGLFFATSLGFAQVTEGEIGVASLKGDIAEADPRSTITLPFRIRNDSAAPLNLVPEASLPEGWSTRLPLVPFSLNPGEENVLFLGLIVPGEAEPGKHRIIFSVRAKDGAPFKKEVAVEIQVSQILEMEVTKVEGRETAIAGEDFSCLFRVSNLSNKPLDIVLNIQDSEKNSFRSDADRFRLEIGESRLARVDVQTNKKLAENAFDTVTLTAVAFGDGLKRTATASVQILARNQSKSETRRRLPLQASIIAISDMARGRALQFSLAGEGYLDVLNKKKLNFRLCGPNDRALNPFNSRDEEYWAVYTTPTANLSIGDNLFSLSQLLEYGYYGRGIQGQIRIGRWSLKSFYHKNRIFAPFRTQTAFQLGLNFGSRAQFHLNVLRNKDAQSASPYTISFAQDNLMASLDSTLSTGKALNLELESAFGQDLSGSRSGQGYALRVNSYGSFKAFSYHQSLIKGSDDFPGYFRGILINTANFNLNVFNRANLFSTLSAAKRSASPDFGDIRRSFGETNIRSGLQISIFQRFNLIGGYNYLHRQETTSDPVFDYKEENLELGAILGLGLANLSFSINKGKTYNLLSQETQGVSEYVGSADLNPWQGLSLGGYVHFRDQSENFTGDRLHRLTMTFHLNLIVKDTALYISTRTGYQRKILDPVLSGIPRGDPLLFLLDVPLSEIRFSQRLFGGHSIGLQARTYGSGKEWRKNAQIMLFYTIPIGVPIGSVPGVGEIGGRIVDRENGDRDFPNIILKLKDRTAVTDKNGNFKFYGVREGIHYLSIDKANLGPNRTTRQKLPIEIQVDGKNKKDVVIEVVTGATISGMVANYKYDDGNLQSNVLVDDKSRQLTESGGLERIGVELRDESGVQYSVTDASGRFIFNDVVPGACQIKVYNDFIPAFTKLEQETFDLNIEPGAKEDLLVKVVPQIRRVQFQTSAPAEISPVTAVDQKAAVIGETAPVLTALAADKSPKAEPNETILSTRIESDVIRKKSNNGIAYLNRVEIKEANDGASILIRSDSFDSYRSFVLKDPNRIVIDLEGVDDIKENAIIPGQGWIKNIRTGMFEPTTARVVLTIDGEIPRYRIEESGEGLRVNIVRGKPGQIENIEFTKVGESLIIILTVSREISAKQFSLDAPERIVIDLYEVEKITAKVPSSVVLSDCGIQTVRTGMYMPDIARIVFEVKSPPPRCEMGHLPGKIVITISPKR